VPRDIGSRYPYSETGEFPAGARGEWHELLTVAAWLAARTQRIRILTSVMVVPHRAAVLTAKILSTIDVLSGGRLTVGCGAGWLKEEFEAVGAPPFAERGAATDEYLAAMKELWTAENPRFDGRYVKFADIAFAPKPVQKPHPPLWIGGESGPALRRAARLGDGWYPIGANPQHPVDTMARYRSAVERLRALAREAGREERSVALAYRCPWYGDAKQARTAEGERRLFTGSPAEVADDLKAFRELGAACVVMALAGPTADATVTNMRRFRDDVMSRL
jgi:probable F420-dependent oxidoreductase